MRIVHGRRAVRILHGRHVVSALPHAPGPTGTIFDILAAAVVSLAPHDRPMALLGFAAGGVVAPLRGGGFRGDIHAADLDPRGYTAFRKVAGHWAGRVTLDKADAADWLRQNTRRYGAIVEDLSVQVPNDVTKPEVSVDALPRLIAKRLLPGGVAVINLLPMSGRSLRSLVELVAAPYPSVLLIHPDGFDNLIVVGAEKLPGAREFGTRIKEQLSSIHSPMAHGIGVRTLRSNGSEA